MEELLRYELVNGAALSLVNRLDRETSGLTLIAKNRSAARQLGRAIQRRLMHKNTWPSSGDGQNGRKRVCTAPSCGRGSRESRIWVKQTVHPAGKECITAFRVERTLESASGPLALVRCIPETGRMHQIRVHLAHLGHSIAGDKIYGPPRIATWNTSSTAGTGNWRSS